MRASPMLNRLLSATVLTQQFLVSMNAQAGTATITAKDSTGATITFEVLTTFNATAFAGITAVCDGVAAAQCAAVKAASTSAAATDPALVVSMSPNSGLSVAANQTAIITLLAAVSTSVASPIPAGSTATIIGGAALYQGLSAVVAEPCQVVTKNYTSINLTSTAALVVATGTTGKLVYVCGFTLQPSVVANVGLIEGTGGTCAGGTTAGVVGGTTAATGLNFSANGGLAQGNGGAAFWATHNLGNNLCLVSSTTSQISGALSFVLL